MHKTLSNTGMTSTGGGLGLLASSYQDDSDNDEEEPDNKRARTDDDGAAAAPPPSGRLPVPEFLLRAAPSDAAEPERKEDHQGRVRSFPHVRGNWATLVYVRLEEGSDGSLAETLRMLAVSKSIRIFWT